MKSFLCPIIRRFSIAMEFFVFALFIHACFSGSLISDSPASAQVAAQERHKIFSSTLEEDLEPTKWEIGNTIISNEDRLELFKNHVSDIGGGYVGLGGTQNFLLSSWANSEWVWLVDFTKRVVAANMLHIAFLKQAETPEKFRALWTKASSKTAMEIIEKEFTGNPEIDYLKRTWKIGLGYIPWRFRNLDRVTKKYKYTIWLNDQKYYDRIRNLALAGRIIARKGNLNGTITIRSIAETAKKMNVPIRLVYLSNAEEYIPSYSENFRKNFTALPSDSRSILLRTISFQKIKYPWAPDSEISTDKGFHYNVMPLNIFQEYLSRPVQKLSVHDIMRSAVIDKENGISVVQVIPESPQTVKVKEKTSSAKNDPKGK